MVPALSSRERLAPVAHPVLVLAWQLAEGLAERRIEEQRVVAEAALPPHLLRDQAQDALLRLEEHLPVARHGHRTREARAAPFPRHAPEAFQEQAVPVEVAGPFPSEPARVEARTAVERVHGQARVVGHRETARPPRVVEGLEGRVLEERAARFFGRGQDAEVAGAQHPERQPFEQQPHLVQLAGVLAGDEQLGLGHGRLMIQGPPRLVGSSGRVIMGRRPIGAWRSLVAHLPWAQVVAGSNPAAPTILTRHGLLPGYPLGYPHSLVEPRGIPVPQGRRRGAGRETPS